MKLRTFAAATLAALAIAGTTFAHEGAMGIVKVRMDAMSAIGDNMKSISAMLTGKAEFDAELVSRQAGEISGHAADFPDHFKEEIEDRFTEASPAIWQKPDEFEKLSKDLVIFAEKLSQNAVGAENGQALMADFSNVAGTCKVCHEQFRVKK